MLISQRRRWREIYNDIHMYRHKHFSFELKIYTTNIGMDKREVLVNYSGSHCATVEFPVAIIASDARRCAVPGTSQLDLSQEIGSIMQRFFLGEPFMFIFSTVSLP